MKITIENKNGEVIRESEYNPAALMVSTGLGLGYGLLARKAYILACRGGIIPSILGTAFGAVISICVGHTTYELMSDSISTKKEDNEDVAN